MSFFNSNLQCLNRPNKDTARRSELNSGKKPDVLVSAPVEFLPKPLDAQSAFLSKKDITRIFAFSFYDSSLNITYTIEKHLSVCLHTEKK